MSFCKDTIFFCLNQNFRKACTERSECIFKITKVNLENFNNLMKITV